MKTENGRKSCPMTLLGVCTLSWLVRKSKNSLSSNPSHTEESWYLSYISSRRLRMKASVCWTGGSRLETGTSQIPVNHNRHKHSEQKDQTCPDNKQERVRDTPHSAGPGPGSGPGPGHRRRPEPEPGPGPEPVAKRRKLEEPGSICVSMRSDGSIDRPLQVRRSRRIQQQRPDSPEPSCLSLKSDLSKDVFIEFKGRRPSADQIVDQESSEVPSAQSAQQHQTQLDSIFMLLEENMVTFVKNELKKMHKLLSPDYPECSGSQREDEEVLDAEDENQRSSREAFVKITVNFLRRMKQEQLADCLQSKSPAMCQPILKSNLKKKFQCVLEGIAKAGNPTLLKQIYTELYITEGGTGEVNDEHEVRQIETASRKPVRPETTIRQEDIFKASPGRDGPIRTVMTKGVAGIGKTVLTQKFTLDWAEDKANQDIQFTFPFTFRELNVLKERKFSLVELVHHFFTETKEAGICRFDQFQVVFIFDGLDECRLPLDFHNTEILTDVTESTSVDVLLTNLIRGKLLPSARLWITTRPSNHPHLVPTYYLPLLFP
ncbi:NACHT, LRR and PYD domains-containing protein 5-like, partial [Seriola dumerili]|uniref:NACHT, LRR and PYD domains-containing protein 5-like n=1 Tax=Seriola dumerili TaxID=41447 RepID=UPI000BBEA7CB